MEMIKYNGESHRLRELHPSPFEGLRANRKLWYKDGFIPRCAQADYLERCELESARLKTVFRPK
jgi:hypothetical protein